VLLIGAGAGIGALLSNSPPGTARASGGSSPAPVRTVTVPAQAPPAIGNYNGYPPGKGTSLQMPQRQGDGSTEFVVHGTGWPGARFVTVTVTGSSAKVRVPVDHAATFAYAIDPDHQFFPGPIPVGPHTVTVAGARGLTRTIVFTVIRPPPGPPGVPPP
jgi:hypothetical protein